MATGDWQYHLVFQAPFGRVAVMPRSSCLEGAFWPLGLWSLGWIVLPVAGVVHSDVFKKGGVVAPCLTFAVSPANMRRLRPLQEKIRDNAAVLFAAVVKPM